MKDLIIVGAGDTSREILQIAKDINRTSMTWNIKGFIADEGLDISQLTKGQYNIVGTIEHCMPRENEVFVCAIATPWRRERVVNQLKAVGAVFTSLIHPTARLDDYCELGEGVVMYPYSSVGSNARLGDYVFLQSTTVAHDVSVGDFTTISSLCGILGRVKLGKRVFAGNHATILPKVSVGDDAYIGAGSVVIRNVRAGTKVFGNPARRVDI
ncbi:NeuD/PglB/VioB family sugar acetyltransferase [Mesotoga sp. UBA5847]|jgi:sugar O-acyltransferase (sialic acid O-acetyltransferase NeuD family)|uniref:NeuD/PglB/VioB family sugar acetyltransferase n=1 Tax=Mesotoga sp. UBA5847 TaxID=1946859 RepID=UPI0025DCA3AD|nr:NeuD/PglB/VioB family sugar acetyltransferase [Mesotoga sp. UBA5847]